MPQPHFTDIPDPEDDLDAVNKQYLTDLISSMGSTVRVSGSNFTTTSLSPVNITGLSFPVSANHFYEVDVLLKCQSTTTAGIAFCITFSAAGATGQYTILSTAPQHTNNVGMDSQILGSIPTGGPKIISANVDQAMFIKAIVTTTSNAGNITVQCQKDTSGTATIYVGSRMTVTLMA